MCVGVGIAGVGVLATLSRAPSAQVAFHGIPTLVSSEGTAVEDEVTVPGYG
jgi:hypothetical protein